MQRNNITFRPQLQGVKDVKVELIDNVFHVYATRIDKRASHCNHKMQIKDYRTVTILLSSYQNKKVILHLKKQRYKYPHCRKTITSQIEAVDKNNNISKEVKDIILEKLSETKSYKQIAKEEKVSVNTVIRVLEKVVIKRQTSPDTSVIYIDEFKGNIGKEKYQLAMYDKNRKLVDILRNRHSQTIENIINEFEIQPQVVVMDMFKPFRSVINNNIVQAQIVADKYHVIRQGIWALRDLRVELFNKDNEKYKKLKKYWKILSKSPISQFSQKQKEILKEILKVDKTLKKMYRIIKEFYNMFESKTVKTMKRRIEQLIEKLRVLNIKQSIKLADTITSWKKEIINIVEYKINNGFVEGNNNKIKVIKRVSYGLRNYERFRKLIYLRLCNR